MTTQTARTVTMKGNPLELIGKELHVGDRAPDFICTANDLKEFRFSNSTCCNKVCLITAVPSLDTSVCSKETHRFNEEAGNLGSDVGVLTVSMDLPFAQKRWCGAEGVRNVTTVSDYRDAAFGNAYGVLIKDLRLLARAIFVVDRQGIIRYIQIVPEIGSEPDYAAALAAARKAAAK
jgi:thioredoxin-dependent peroxiredoxin